MCAGQEQIPPGAAAPAVSKATSIVQGKVVQEPGGQGIRKVKVSFRGGSGQRREQYEAVTDEAGQFKVEDVEPGTYFLQLERSGYSESGKTSRDRVIKVNAGQDTKDLVFHMQGAGVITGKIVDFDGDPLRGISVAATPSSGSATRRNSAQVGNAATNDLGEYRIADLPPGKYLVQATPPENQAALPGPNEKNAPKDRLVFVTTYFPGTLDERQGVAVEVPAGGTAAANFGLQATRVYRVSGTIVGLSAPPKPQPQSGGSVAFMVATRQGMGQIILVGKNGQTKEQNLREDGTFEFSGVPAGTYRAQFISFSGFLNGQAPSLKMQAFRTPIEVNGSDVIGLQLQVEPGGDVSGRFRLEGNEKIDWKQLYVTLVPKSEEGSEGMGVMMPMGHAMLNEDGSFEIKDAPLGDCQLAVGTSSEKFRDYYTKSVLLGGREVVDTGFSVTPGTLLDVVVSAKGAGVEGTVVDGAGKPVAEANVVTLPSSGKLGRPDAYQFGRTDEKGHFDLLGMNPGEFLVLAFEEIQEDYRTPEFVKKYEGKGEKVELEEGGKKSVVLKLITEESEKR
jgi:hypothetical protein